MSHDQPTDAAERRAKPALVCYDVKAVPNHDEVFIKAWRETLQVVDTVVVPPRDAATFEVPAGHGFRIVSVDGAQVGDLNLWNRTDINERFFSGKTRQLHATHITRGDRLWSSLPGMRSMATVTHDTLEWYGWDSDGGGVHDVIGTRCDPYTNKLLKGTDYHYCCHSNLSRALAKKLDQPIEVVEPHVHDVLNVFMCTGFTLDTHQYFMKASPVRPGDFIEFIADIDLLGALSSCPGGDCGSSHSDDSTPCYPLHIDIMKPDDAVLRDFQSQSINAYDRSHGL
ncbi:MAG: urea carboxylase-associated family protein [Granulosicoccus sp.]